MTDVVMRVLDDIQDSFPITGRGIAFSGPWRLRFELGEWEPWDIRGETVLLGGVEVKVLGVDAFASPRSPESPYRHTFAVVVSEEDAERVLNCN